MEEEGHTITISGKEFSEADTNSQGGMKLIFKNEDESKYTMKIEKEGELIKEGPLETTFEIELNISGSYDCNLCTESGERITSCKANIK